MLPATQLALVLMLLTDFFFSVTTFSFTVSPLTRNRTGLVVIVLYRLLSGSKKAYEIAGISKSPSSAATKGKRKVLLPASGTFVLSSLSVLAASNVSTVAGH